MGHPIIDELNNMAKFTNWPSDQKAFYVQRAKDAKPVQCVRMRDVFTADQMQFLFKTVGYKTKQHQCYKNASDLVQAVEWMAMHYDSSIPETKYVEGFGYSAGILPIEHAFVKVGDQYIDPTFERALHRDVRNELYVSCIELDPAKMALLQSETGYYGELYLYDYMKRFRPELAAKMNRSRE